MATGIVLFLLGVWLVLRTVVPNQPGGNLVNRILGSDGDE